jgi:flagellar hook-associated protein 2
MFVSAKESGEASDFTLSGTGMALTALGLSVKNNGANKIDGQDAKILLNNAEFSSSSNSFEINGLTITAMNTTAEDEVITVTTEQDTDGIYDLVKNFLKEYNSLVNEMDKLYNADSAKGYEPLTDEEKSALSETEVEEWEEKIKASLLRRDDNLSTINSALQEIMSSGIEINGKTMYLHDFGIENLGYFNAADNEKHAYHIDGDPDNEYTSGNADKLKTMISNDPDTVISFFTKLSQNLYGKMSELSASRDGYRSFGNFYDDKKMKSDYTDYTSKIAELEEKLADYEDTWYSKFSKMETALAKMQSNSSAVTSLLGG